MDYETYVLTPGKMSGTLLIVDFDILQGRISDYHSIWISVPLGESKTHSLQYLDGEKLPSRHSSVLNFLCHCLKRYLKSISQIIVHISVKWSSVSQLVTAVLLKVTYPCFW